MHAGSVVTQTKTYQPPFTDGNTIRCSDAPSNNMQCKYRIASNGTSQARIRPISSALSISDQAPKKKAWAIRATFLSSPSLSAFRRYHLALSPTLLALAQNLNDEQQNYRSSIPQVFTSPTTDQKWPSESLSASDSLITPPPTGGGSSRLPEASWSFTT